MESNEESDLGGGSKRKGNPGRGFNKNKETLGGGSNQINETLGGGSNQINETLGGGSKRRKTTLGGGYNRINETLGGGSKRRKATLGGGLRLKYGSKSGKIGLEGDSSDQDGYETELRQESTKGSVNKRRRVSKGKRASRSPGRKPRCALSSGTGDESSSPQLRRDGNSRKRHDDAVYNNSSESRSESPSPQRGKLSKRRERERDTKLIDKFLSIIEKVRGSDRPKLTFNANVVPEFDPMSREQTVLTWITKVEECAEIYGWEEREIIHYSLPKLSGVARTWYQGLTSVLYTWSEWKKKLLESFPCREDYAELLTEMLAKRVKYGESLEHYYYAKINLLNRCGIAGKQAVDCLLYGIEDRAVKVGAQAAQFRDPEQVLKYFRTVKIGQIRDNPDTTRRGKFGTGSSRPDSSKSSNATNPTIRCFNCNEVGHPSFRCEKPTSSLKCHNCNTIGHRSSRCEKPPVKCTTCDRIGHLTSNCYRNAGRLTADAGKDSTLGNSKQKQVSEVVAEDSGIDKYVMDIKVNGSTISCHVDLGSQCSLIRVSAVKSLGLQIFNRANLPTLRGIGASLVSPLGKVIATVVVQGVSETIDLYVVEDYVLMHPVLLGHSFTEKPDVLIIKTPNEIQFHKMPPNKIRLVATYDCEIPCNTMRAVQVTTDTQILDCEVHVKGTLRGPVGKEYYLLPGQYEIKEGRGAILIFNISEKPMSITKGTLLTRSLERNQPQTDNIKNSFSVSFDDEVMDTTVNCNPDLDPIQRQELKRLLTKYGDCFSSGLLDLGYTTVTEMTIELIDGDPIVYRPYRMSHAERLMVSNMIQEMLDSKIIRESSSPYASPIIMVQKKTGEKRLCIDYRALNRKTKRDHYPMPRIEDQLDLLSGNTLFTSLDLASGYYQIPISEESRPKTAFVTPDGQFEFNRMPFGLVNAPSVFQRTINKILIEAKIKYALVYMDDVLIPSKDFGEGLQRLEEVLLLMRKGGLTLKLSKCCFFLSSVDFLGFDVSADGIRPGCRKSEAVSKFPRPTNQHEVRQFLGLSGFFRRFIKNYAMITAPLTDLLRKNVGWSWNNERELAFEKVKDLLTKGPLLALYDPKAEMELHTDACKDGVAGILLQRNSNGALQPVSYFSRKTTDQERKLHSYELETLAVVASLNRFRVYLIGIPFKILTDCNALRATLIKRDLIPRIARWWIQLQEYDCTIEYRPGARMTHADALSRNPVSNPVSEQHILDVLPIQVSNEDWISTVQSADEEIKKIKQTLLDPSA
ncbi:jg19309 [Pararge aegeria aegeria]|uniref:RNA-directed DNA polymerase n=1 Tax=Pararge aegeria aegeria TaxID=348720 RepID=A0A8S4QUY1_9NEOP|nr:jg19309 [Pararge aegeria aegeria]